MGVEGQAHLFFREIKKKILADYKFAKTLAGRYKVQVRHGFEAEASVRKWLSEFLPAKYGVTSGYIINNNLFNVSENDKELKLSHFDVIIYDKMESPIYWVDENYDESGLGAKKGIPIEFVKAIFEVKSSFNQAKEISKKLDEIISIKEFDNEFFFGFIIFELNQGLTTKKQESLIAHLFKSNPKYIGGMILSGYNPDPNKSIPESELDNFSLELEISQTDITNQMNQIDLYRGGLFLTSQNQPNYLFLCAGWSINSFPMFATNIVRRLNRTYVPYINPNFSVIKSIDVK